MSFSAACSFFWSDRLLSSCFLWSLSLLHSSTIPLITTDTGHMMSLTGAGVQNCEVYVAPVISFFCVALSAWPARGVLPYVALVSDLLSDTQPGWLGVYAPKKQRAVVISCVCALSPLSSLLSLNCPSQHTFTRHPCTLTPGACCCCCLQIGNVPGWTPRALKGHATRT